MAMELQGKRALINGGKGTGALPEPAIGVLVQFRAKSARSPRRSIMRVLVPRLALATCNFDIGRARSLQELSFICSCAGFCAAGGIVGLYAIFLRGFPVGSRASGSGLGFGVGRCASAVAPIAAGRFDPLKLSLRSASEHCRRRPRASVHTTALVHERLIVAIYPDNSDSRKLEIDNGVDGNG